MSRQLFDVAVVLGASVFARVCVLVCVSGFGSAFPAKTYIPLLYLIGVSLAIQVMLDLSSVSMYFVKMNGSLRAWRAWHQGFQLASLAGAVIVAVTVATAVLVDASSLSLICAAGSLAVLAASESVARHLRWVWQAQGRFFLYCSVDLAVGCGRLLVGAGVIWTKSLLALSVSSIAVATLLLVLFGILTREGAANLWRDGGEVRMRRLMKELYPYVLSVLASTSYSQMPTLLVGIRSSVLDGALYTGVTRFTQPTEMIPSSISSVMLPRLVSDIARRSRNIRLQVVASLIAGVTVGLSLLVFGAVFARLLHLPWHSVHGILFVLAIGLPIRYLNYQLVSIAVAKGRIRTRMKATIVVAVGTLIALWFLAPLGGVATALVAVSADVALAIMLTIVDLTGSRRGARNKPNHGFMAPV